jgi:DUF4097 and DUF4098 domain-containing protein YvlB
MVMPNRDKILITVVLLVSAAILFSKHPDGVFAAGSVDGTFSRSFNVSGPVQLNLDNGSGSVTIRRGAAGKVEVNAKMRAHNWFSNAEEEIKKIEQNPPVEQSGNSIRIYRPEPKEIFNRVSISYDITVPEDTSVRSSTGSGSQNIDGVAGPVYARSGSGSLHLTSIGSQVEAKTGSGSIELDGIKGSADIETGSGSVHANGVGGGSKIHTGSGGIDLRQTAPGDVEAQTGSGHIRLEGLDGAVRASAGSGGIDVEGRPKGQWQFHSGSGGIDIRTAGDVGLDLYAKTSSGRVTVAPPITIENSQLNNREVRGKVRGGGIPLEATTGSGSINIQ